MPGITTRAFSSDGSAPIYGACPEAGVPCARSGVPILELGSSMREP